MPLRRETLRLNSHGSIALAARWAGALLCLVCSACTDFSRHLDPLAVIYCSNIGRDQGGGGAYLACVQEQMARLHPQSPPPTALASPQAG